MQDQRAPPFRTEGRLAPLYDAALSIMSREGRWRTALAEQVAPEPHDIILDIGCGGGALSILIARLQPAASIIGFDSRGALLDQARARAQEAGVRVSFIQAEAHDAGPYTGPRPPTKIVLTLTGLRTAAEKLGLMQIARQIVDPAGTLHVVDFTPRRSDLMRRLLSAPIETLVSGDVRPSTASGGEAATLIRAAGFVAVEETATWPTPSGAVSLYRARAS